MAVLARPVDVSADPTAPAPQRRPFVWVGGALLLLAGMATRFYAINGQSLWYDEGVSAGMVGQDALPIIRQAAADFHPPLYYLLLAGWARLFGDSVVALRGLSAVSGIVLVLLTWRLATRLFGSRAGWYAGVWATVAPLGIAFSQELRMYMPVAAAVALAAYCALRWLDECVLSTTVRRQHIYLAGYVLAAIVALYFQYVAALGLAAIGVYGLLRARRRALGYWIAANALAVLVFAPWVPVFHHQLTVGRTATTTQTSVGQVLTAATSSLLVGADGLPFWNRAAVVVMATFGLLGAWRAGAAGRRGALPLLLVVVPLVGVTAYAAWKSVYEVRYILVALPGVALLGGLGIQTFGMAGTSFLRRRTPVFSLSALVLTVAVVGVADVRYYLAPLHPHDDYRGLAAAIAGRSQPGDAVLLYPPGQSNVFSYYYRGPDAVTSLPTQRPPDAAAVTASLATLLQTHARIWVVEYGATEADPQGIVSTWLAGHAYLAGHQWFGSPQLLLYIAGSPTVTSTTIGVQFNNRATLQSYAVAARTLVAGGFLEITLTWLDRAPIPDRYSVFTHILDANDRVVAQHDGEPAGGTRATTTWQPGEVIPDRHGIVLPAQLPAGVYTIEVGMYRSDGGARAQILPGPGGVGTDHVFLGSIVVRSATAP
ncbi:MAG: glycosyltransferase family 39 protein [Chloroflexota bacterium]